MRKSNRAVLILGVVAAMVALLGFVLVTSSDAQRRKSDKDDNGVSTVYLGL